MTLKDLMPDARGRVVSYYHASYQRAMERVERERDRMFEVVRRALGNVSRERAAWVIGVGAHRSAEMTFDEVLFWLCEQVCSHGSGSITAWATEPQALSA